jgi:hypothetical protein
MNLVRGCDPGEPGLGAATAHPRHDGKSRARTAPAVLAGLALAALANVALLPPAARAQGADVTRLTCGQLLDARGGEPERLLVWLHGYYAGAAQRAILEPRQAEEAVAAMRKACEGDRALPLIGPQARAIFLSATPLAEAGPAPPAPAAAPAGPAPSAPARPTPVR